MLPWFKHYRNARESNTLSTVIAKFGVEGYGRYWILLEELARKFDGEDQTFVFSLRDMKQIMGTYHTHTLLMFLQCLSDLGLMSFECKENVLTISTPILLKLKDRRFKKAHNERIKDTPKIGDRREKSKSIAHSAHSFDIDAVYAKYPRKQGKKRGIEKLKRSIKKPEQFSKLMQAVENYASYCKREQREQKFIKQFSTWAGEWEDWIEIETPSERTAPGPLD